MAGNFPPLPSSQLIMWGMIRTPERIGRYEIQGELGRGGMSTVYRGHDPHFGRDVAMKLLADSLSDNRTFRTRFEREAKTIATLDHPAIVPVYDFGEDEDKRPFLVMRLMTGGTLADRLKMGPLSMQDILTFFQRIAPALDEAHTHGIVHRDLKPSNFLYDQRDVPFITDFGIAKLRDAQTQITQAGGMIGTPAYMSPEQIQARTVLDGRSDIYALGVLLYEMLTGAHPFQADTAISIAMKHLNDPIPPITGLSSNWQAVIQKAMAKNRDARYETTTALTHDIETLITEVKDITQTAVTPSLSTPAHIHALLIVNNQYQHPQLKQLPQNNIHTPQLAEALRPYCQEVTTLTNLPFSDMRRTIAQLVNHRKPDQTIWLYYVGHGLVDHRQQLYLTAVDTDPDILRSTALSATYISEELNSSQASNQILLLDCAYHHMRLNHTTPLPLNSGRIIGLHNGRLIITTHTHAYPLYGKHSPTSTFSTELSHLLQTARATHSLRHLINEIKGRLIRHDEALPNIWTINETTDITLKKQTYLKTPILNASPKIDVLDNKTILPTPSIPASPKRAWLWGGLMVLLTLAGLLFGGWFRAQRSSPPTITPAPAVGVVLTNTPSATATNTSTPTPSATATNAPTPTHTAIATNTPTSERNQAIADLPSSVFSQPTTNSTELATIQPQETVLVLGRAPTGRWVYISTLNQVEGYVYAPRLLWQGEFEALPIIYPTTQTSATSKCTNACPQLEIDLYALPNTTCVDDTVYQQVFIGGRGGNETYTYFWDGEQVARNRSNGHAFEVSGIKGSTVIGTGEVRSGDGQTAVADLFLNLSCNDK